MQRRWHDILGLKVHASYQLLSFWNTIEILHHIFIARRAIVFAMIGSGTRKLMCESCPSVCPSVWDVTIRSRSGNHLHHLRAISQKFDFFYFFECVCKGVFQFSVSFCWDTADDCLIIEDDGDNQWFRRWFKITCIWFELFSIFRTQEPFGPPCPAGVI